MGIVLTNCKKVAPLDSAVVESIAMNCSLRAQKGEYTIIYTTHARQQMEKRNIDQKHVLQVLEFGRLVEEQTRFDEKEKDFSYLLRDQDVEERDMAVSIAIRQASDVKVIVVTAMIIDPVTGKFI